LFLPDRAVADYYTGHCARQPGREIATNTLRRCCNRGYARHSCEHAATEEADAAQFLVKADRDGIVEIAWSLERNHHPIAVGVFAVEPGLEGATPLEIQAIALANDYLEQKGNRE
jgi:hypothetical protein